MTDDKNAAGVVWRHVVWRCELHTTSSVSELRLYQGELCVGRVAMHADTTDAWRQCDEWRKTISALPE